MILVFGGTTEGLKTIQILDFVGEKYWYSTKSKVDFRGKGTPLWGEMQPADVVAFCRQHSIRLFIDAAHPFATRLHETIAQASKETGIPVLRFERSRQQARADEHVRSFHSFAEMEEALLKSNYQRILALTGVQTIERLRRLWQERTCFFRILDTDLSRKKSKETGISEDLVFPAQPSDNVDELVAFARTLEVDILLSKDSGESGFLPAKIAAARSLGIPLWVVERPPLPDFDTVVYSEKELLQHLYGYSRTILKKDGSLRGGFTTGTCVLAAAKACLLALVEGHFPEQVSVELPDGERVPFLIFDGELEQGRAACRVIKNAGDDPDVTHAHEIGCSLQTIIQPGIRFERGEGVGLVTLPGLQLPVGEPAINPGPRRMIEDMLTQLAQSYHMTGGFIVTPFVPKGEELARSTFNERVGVLGGISIVGTTGRIVPFSNEAFVASIKKQLQVLRSMGGTRVVFTSGKRSEVRIRDDFKGLGEQAFVHFGNRVGEVLKLAVECSISDIIVVLQLGKAVKLAAGMLDTHSKKGSFDAGFLGELARGEGVPEEKQQALTRMKLANELPGILPPADYSSYYRTLAEMCLNTCQRILPAEYSITFVMLIDEQHRIRVSS